MPQNPPAHRRPRFPRVGRSLLWATLLLTAALCRAADTNEGAPWPDDLFREAADADIKQGYTLREDSWKGALAVRETKTLAYHCSAGNEYRFYLGSDVRDAKLSVHIYDDNGNLTESRSWQTAKDGANFSGANVVAKRSGTYFLVVKVESSSEGRTPWNMGFSFK